MKIVHVYKDAFPPLVAGITRYIDEVSRASVARGASVDVLVAGVRRSRVDVMPAGQTIRRYAELGRVLSMPISVPLALAARRAEADVLHVHMPNPIGELGALGTRSPRIVATFHSQLGRQRWLERVYAPLRERLFARAAAVIVASEPMASAPELLSARDRIVVVPYGVPSRFANISRALGTDGPMRVLFVGRLVYYKGLDVLLEALDRGVTGWTLTIVGEGPARADLERDVQQRQVGNRVRFAGRLSDDDLADEYARHDVFVMPSVSRAEAFGIAAIEGMASGLALVSTALGTGTDWINIDGETGLVVKPSDAAGLAHAIDRLAGDRPLLARMQQRAKELADDRFSFDRHMDRLWSIYESGVS